MEIDCIYSPQIRHLGEAIYVRTYNPSSLSYLIGM